MKGKYKIAIVSLLIILLLPLLLILTLGYWLPTLVGIWLPTGTRIEFHQTPHFTRSTLSIPDLRYFVGECELAALKNVTLSHPHHWQLHVHRVDLDVTCFNHLPQNNSSPEPPLTLAQWQSMLPNSELDIDTLTVFPWQKWQGKLSASLSEKRQELDYQGDAVTLHAYLQGQQLVVSQFQADLIEGEPPVKLVGQATMPLIPNGVPIQGHVESTFQIPLAPSLVDTELDWQGNQGQFIVMARGESEPLLDLPWQLTPEQFTVSDGRWYWPYQADLPMSGRLALQLEDWQQGLEKMQVRGRLNVLTSGDAGKGNAVLTLGPGTIGLEKSHLPLRVTGEAKQNDLIFYAKLSALLSGPINDPTLAFLPGSLLLSHGHLMADLNIDDIRLPLAGVKISPQGIDGRLQAILRAHESQTGDFVLHLDGLAEHFMPDSGSWRWRYWGEGHFTPMQALWDVAGTGEWRDRTIVLDTLSTGFDQLHYGTMTIDTPRLSLKEPIYWVRGAQYPSFSGTLLFVANETHFSRGSVLPASTLIFSVQGHDPTHFKFKGDLQAEDIGPVKVSGRWDGERLRGRAWWPKQSLTVFQPLIPPDWKMALRDGSLYAQIAFSAAAGQGFEAGGHGVLRQGSVWMPDNEMNGVDFILPFRFKAGVWTLGTHRPVSLRIAEVVNQVTAHNITADLQGSWPWSEETPLQLSNLSVDLLGGRMTIQQLRLPQHDPALLRLKQISMSELVGAINPKQFAMSGPVDGGLPLWLNGHHGIIQDGWLHNPGPMTLRLDKDTADAIAADNMAAGAAINWLRYLEISQSWTRINLDNQGELTLSAAVTGTGEMDGKRSTVRLNYSHQENVFDLWRSLRFGDKLESWLEQHASVLTSPCRTQTECEEQ